jgi:hypothetical protein
MKAYVSSVSDVSEICCNCFIWMLQVFERFVQNISSIPDICCKRSNLDVAYVLHICCNYMFQIFQSYVAISVFMLQVASVLSGCCICFIHILQLYVLDVLFISYIRCIQVFHILRRVRGAGSDSDTAQVPENGGR